LIGAFENLNLNLERYGQTNPEGRARLTRRLIMDLIFIVIFETEYSTTSAGTTYSYVWGQNFRSFRAHVIFNDLPPTSLHRCAFKEIAKEFDLTHLPPKRYVHPYGTLLRLNVFEWCRYD
jgi:hypothetical protein